MIVVEEKKKNKYRDKNILVVGLARSGTGAANLLASMGAKVTITDKKSGSSLESQIMKLSPSVKVITDGMPKEVFDEADMVVVSPGVPLDIDPLLHTKAKGIPIIGELELAYQIVASSELRVSVNTRSRKHGTHNTELATPSFIGVTGTNGKSTTITLIDLMLKESGYKTLLGGNIGNALTEEISNALNIQQTGRGERLFAPAIVDYIVTEISSFQLESVKEFRPGIAVILNITPDHLDRYDSINDYINAKARIFENQTSEDYLILNADDPATMELYNAIINPEPGTVQGINQKSKLPEALFFSRKKEVHGVYCRDGKIYCNLPPSLLINRQLPINNRQLPLIDIDKIRIKGIHNLENAMAASLVALISGCPCQAIVKMLRDFPGLEHRLEFVGEVKGVRFINDSKGTNVGAVAKSLEDFKNVILIMGGLDKGSDFSVLHDLIKRKVKLLILIGEAKEKIAQAVGGATETRKVRDLKEAVNLSMSKAFADYVVLLSPGCASFDMFTDFEDRGRKFKEAVRELTNDN
jgi:UDP-N-acetylmuramoylalanine--D-glutamate ligase